MQFPIKRKKTRPIKIGGVKIGGKAPIAVQSMTNTLTQDVKRTVLQIKRLEAAGCEIATLTPEERQAFRTAVKPMHDDARKQFAPELHRSTDLQSIFE